MKKSTKFFVNLFILVAFAAAVFFIGWVQFYVKPGNCGVMISKTSGVYEKPLIAGKFAWRWERLLPTNVTITSYSLEPMTCTSSLSGSLPGSDVYSKLVEPKADFSYNLSLTMKVSLEPEGIVDLVKKKGLTSQEDLERYVKEKQELVISRICQSMIEQEQPLVTAKSLEQQELDEIKSRYSRDLEYLNVESITVNSIRIPDRTVYERAKQAYMDYEQALSDEMKLHAKEQAESLLEEDRTMIQLEKFAQLLSNYPELADFAKTGDITQILNTLRNLR